jgi:hypothetical protein
MTPASRAVQVDAVKVNDVGVKDAEVKDLDATRSAVLPVALPRRAVSAWIKTSEAPERLRRS